MKKIILIIIGLVVIVGAIWLFSSNDSGPTEEASVTTGDERAEQTTSDTEAPDDLSGLGSLQNIVGQGDSVRCEFKSTVEGQTSEGVFYTDGERFRVDATLTTPDMGVMNSNMINDGDIIYTWGDSPEGTMAIKMTIPEEEANDMGDFDNPMADSPAESYVDFEQEVEYDCDRWSADNSVFVPPSDIEFMDMEAMMQEAMQGMPEGFEMPAGVPSY